MLFIFDWDGTLSDSTGKIIRCMQTATRRVGLEELSDDAIRNIIGLGLPEAIKALYPDATDAHVNAIRRAYSEVYLAEDQTPSPFYPRVEETLHRLRDDGYRLTVATGKSRRGLERVLRGLGMTGFFHGSRCADETASKPHPMMLNQLLQELKYEADGAVMVGDTEYDMEMAQRAGIPRVAVSYGAHDISRLTGYNPTLCIDVFSELTALVDASPLMDKLQD